jgi:ankyrin repeat protein
VNGCDAFGQSPLFFADSHDAASLLLDNGANTALRSRRGDTALDRAILRERDAVFKALSESRGLTANEDLGLAATNPLWLAAASQCPEIFAALIHQGLDPYKRTSMAR